jgi:uncharacterized lipoprotein YddW (UPF0748 family)
MTPWLLSLLLSTALGPQADAAPRGPALEPPPPPKQELRGAWVTRWTWNNPDDIAGIFNDLVRGGFNTVFFQVRGTFDAFYDSPIEPWAARLTGELGKDPGWDPLAVAVREGHARGLAVHAYINVFPLWRGDVRPRETVPPHAYVAHPEWVAADRHGRPMQLSEEGYVFASPGNPEVRDRAVAVCEDIATRYAVDGIHLDYIRYSSPAHSHDPVSNARFAAERQLRPELSRAAWQEEQINWTASAISDAVDVPVSAAVWGIRENVFGWTGVSQGRQDYAQNSRTFLTDGLVDAIIPMTYWPVAATPGDKLDFRTLVADHLAHGSERHVYAGVGNENLSIDQAIEAMLSARQLGAEGVVLFDHSLFADHMDRFRTEVFAEPAVPPTMPWRREVP